MTTIEMSAKIDELYDTSHEYRSLEIKHFDLCKEIDDLEMFLNTVRHAPISRDLDIPDTNMTVRELLYAVSGRIDVAKHEAIEIENKMGKMEKEFMNHE